MAYKIKNVTNLLDKRHPFLNSGVEIEYNRKNIIKETIKLKVGEELIFDSDDLPISVHNLKIKKFIRVTKITESQVHGLLSEAVKAIESSLTQINEGEDEDKKPTSIRRKNK